MFDLSFKSRLKTLRTERGITQDELAHALGVPASTIRRYESSDEGMPKQERLQLIADYFNCSVDYLMERTDQRNKEYKNESEIYSLPESVYDKVIREAEEHYGVNLRDDPVAHQALRELILSLAKMKKGNQ